MKIGIVGAGIMGLAAAWALQRRGASVSVFEQYAIPNPLGSSVDQHRLIRYPYGDQLGYCRMVEAAYAAWARLWADLGDASETRTLYAETGTIGLDGGKGDWAARSLATMAAAGVPFERLAPADLARRFPHLNADGIGTAFYQPNGGALFAGRIVERLAHHLATTGVALHPKTRIAEIDPERARFLVGDGRAHSFDRVLIAAGAWLTRLAPAFAARVTPSRQLVVYVEPPPAHKAAWAAAPMVVEFRGDSAFYAVPPRAGLGLKFGDHNFTLGGDPDRDREATRAEAETLLAGWRGRFRDGDAYRIVEAKTCFYDVEPREQFILEPLAAAGWVMAGFSGHGFKFGALMGEIAAAAMLGEKSADWVRRYAAGA
jgi:glycine/D-amino acid oxidase-like deaminating enzyme